jgi:UPF0271 protein
VLTDPDAAAAQALRLAQRRPLPALPSGSVLVAVDTICLHGDTPDAIAIARAVSAALDRATPPD